MNFSRMSLLDRRYRVTYLLARHDTETHYAARHVALDRRVRLIVFPYANADESADDVCAWTTRAARMRHPVLPRVRDCFRVEESMCVVMDEAPGQRLDERLRARGPLAEREALTMGLLLADALDHLLGRDEALAPLSCITPDALTLSRDDRVTLAYLRPRSLLAPIAPCRCAVCRAYLAPELLLGEEADVRADLYSLAAVLRYTLGGASHEDSSDSATTRHATEGTAVLRAILDRALARDPRDRYQSPDELASAFVEASAALPETSLLNIPAPNRAEQIRAGAKPLSSPTDTRATFQGKPATDETSPTTSDVSQAGARIRVRHSGRRALDAIATALHISA